MDERLLGSSWHPEGKTSFISHTRIAQFIETFQIMHSWKAKNWTWGTNPNHGKYPQLIAHSLSLKETRSHNKRMATVPLGNSSYLWHLTGSREVHSGATFYSICTTPGPSPIRTERRVLADSRVHGEISSHFFRQFKCHLTNHHYLKLIYSTFWTQKETQTFNVTA